MSGDIVRDLMNVVKLQPVPDANNDLVRRAQLEQEADHRPDLSHSDMVDVSDGQKCLGPCADPIASGE